MKTTKRIASPLLALICVFMLGLTSCTKDDMEDITPVKAPSDMNSGKVAQPFEMVMIKHTGASVGDKAYSVTMSSNGKVTFIGQANTAVLGQRTIDMGENAVQMVKDYLKQINFYELSEPAIVNDLATVSIGYRSAMNVDVFTNTSNDTPDYEMYIFARQLESMMGINSLVNSDNRREAMNSEKN
jgi:hypothetical protein